jgi:hypothetical protein
LRSKLHKKAAKTWGDQYYNLLHDDGLRKKAEILTPPTIFLRKSYKKIPPYPIFKKKLKKKFHPPHFT